MSLEVLAHGKAPDFLSSEDTLHGKVGGEVVEVFRVLQPFLSQIGPQQLNYL